MQKSKALARANWKGSGDKSIEERWFKVREELNSTEFLGYEFNKAEGVWVRMYKWNGRFRVKLIQLLPNLPGLFSAAHLVHPVSVPPTSLIPIINPAIMQPKNGK